MAAHSPTPDARPASDVIAEADAAAVEQDSGPEKQFHGWRLLGVLFLVIVATAIVSAAVDLAVIPR